VARVERHVKPWEGDLVRAVRLKYAFPSDLVSGKGSFERGGRWNPPGIFPAVYGSLDAAVALEEARGIVAAYGIPREALRERPLERPVYMNAVHARVSRLLDLTQGEVRKAVRVSRSAMCDEQWRTIQNHGEEALTQALGRACWEEGFEGILVPSAAVHKATNAVFFPDRLLQGSLLTPMVDLDLL
jgi:RES domain-containing protein